MPSLPSSNLFARSPYYISEVYLGSAYATLEIQVNSVTVYNLQKDCDSTGRVTFEISELLRDYIDPEYLSGTLSYLTHSKDYDTILKFYNSSDVQLGTNYTRTGFIMDAYGYFDEGANPTTTRGYLQSNDIVYRLSDSDIRIPVDVNNTSQVTYQYQGEVVHTQAVSNSSVYSIGYVSNNTYAYDSFKDRVLANNSEYEDNPCIRDFLSDYETFPVDTIHLETSDGLKVVKVKTLDECRYKPVKLSFINRWGAMQDLWFFRKSIEKISTKKEEYKRAIMTNDSYDTYLHPRQVYNLQSQEMITINTGYVDESYNDPMQELMQSELVWLEQDTKVYPVVVDTSSLTYKTSVNDKLVDYTIELSMAFDGIQNIR